MYYSDSLSETRDEICDEYLGSAVAARGTSIYVSSYGGGERFIPVVRP